MVICSKLGLPIIFDRSAGRVGRPDEAMTKMGQGGLKNDRAGGFVGPVGRRGRNSNGGIDTTHKSDVSAPAKIPQAVEFRLI